MTQEKIYSYAIGDTVKFTEEAIEANRHRGGAVQGVITASTCVNGLMEYAVGGAAWFAHSELDFVRRAGPATLAYASINDDSDDEDGMGDPDEYDFD